jgi:hypothetical protein
VEEGKQHHGHNKLQVYRTSNRPSVLEEQIGNLLVDLQSIQRYSINQKTVVFITGPNSKIYCPNPKSNMNSKAAAAYNHLSQLMRLLAAQNAPNS